MSINILYTTFILLVLPLYDNTPLQVETSLQQQPKQLVAITLCTNFNNNYHIIILINLNLMRK